MGGVTFKWAKEPVELGRDIERFGRLVGSKVEQAVRATGIEAAGRMKQNRPWSDVTGNARRGLRSEVAVRDRLISLYLIHSVEYGVNLELGHAGYYAVIVPEIYNTLNELEDRLDGLL